MFICSHVFVQIYVNKIGLIKVFHFFISSLSLPYHKLAGTGLIPKEGTTKSATMGWTGSPIKMQCRYGKKTRNEIVDWCNIYTLRFCVLSFKQNCTVIIFFLSRCIVVYRCIPSASAAVSWQPGRQPAVDKVKYTAGRAERSEPAYDLRGR